MQKKTSILQFYIHFTSINEKKQYWYVVVLHLRISKGDFRQEVKSTSSDLKHREYGLVQLTLKTKELIRKKRNGKINITHECYSITQQTA